MRKTALTLALLAVAACQSGDGDRNAASAERESKPPASGARDGQQKENLASRLAASADHKTLANALEAAGLADTLSGAQPYTLFAPTDAAFQKAGGANALLAPEAKGKLVALLTAHIVPGVVTAADLGRAIDRGKGKAQLATMAGGTLSFSRSGDAVIVSGPQGGQARLAGDGIAASNGVIHSVDGLLATP